MPKKAAGVKMSLSEATVKFGIDPRAGQLPTHSEGKDFGKGKGKGGLREFDDSRAENNDWGRGGKDGGKGRRGDLDTRAETGDWRGQDGGGGGRSGGGFRGGDRRQDDTEADKDRDWRGGGGTREDRGGDNRRGGGRGDDERWGGVRGSGDAPPTERKRLNLQPRTKPLEEGQAQVRSSAADKDGERRKPNPFGAARASEEADSGRPAPPWKSKRATETREPESKENQDDDDWNTVPSSKKTASTSKTSSKMEEAKSSKSLKKRKESSDEEDESDEDSDETPLKKSDEKKAYVPPGRAKDQQQKKQEQEEKKAEEKRVQKEAEKKLTEKEKKKQLKEQEKQESREKSKKEKKEKKAKDEEEVPEDPKQTENSMLAAFEERCESLLNKDADVEELVDEAPSLLPEGSIQTVAPISLLFGRMLRHCHGKTDEEVVALVQQLAPLLTWLINQAKVHRFKVLVLCELQRLAHKLGLPRLSPATSLIEAVFDGLYCSEVIEEDYFQIWSINDDDTPGKTDAMFQLSAFLDWLRDAKIEGETSSEEEEDDEDREDDEEEEEDSDIEQNIPKRPMRR